MRVVEKTLSLLGECNTCDRVPSIMRTLLYLLYCTICVYTRISEFVGTRALSLRNFWRINRTPQFGHTLYPINILIVKANLVH